MLLGWIPKLIFVTFSALIDIHNWSHALYISPLETIEQ